MGLFALLTRGLPASGRKGRSWRLEAAPFSPRRLECRRLLDASAAGLLLSPDGDPGEFVQVGENLDTSASPQMVSARGADSGNLPPSNIQFASVVTIDENQFTELRLTFDDPGILDTHTVEIDWGDGTTTTIELEGGERFISTPHQYLDDTPTGPAEEPYTITVTVTDNGGESVTNTTTALVKNVAPEIDTLTVTPTVVSEGNFVTLSGDYSDVGTLDTHTATIRWGDGTVEEVDLVGENGSGSFAISHFYADNDTVNPDDGPIPDNLYTITITLADDDGGEFTETIDVTVRNVSPNLEPLLGAVDINAQGEASLTIQFSDPGTDTLTVFVDWGDVRDPNDPSIPALDPFVIDLTGLEGPGVFTVTLKHVYDGPPNPLSPASDIEIFVFVGDDDFGQPFASVFENGQSQIRMATISNPGLGPEPVRIDTTPQVPALLFPRKVGVGFYSDVPSDFKKSLGRGEVRAPAAELNATTDRYLELRVIDSLGQPGEGYRLKAEVLNDLPGLFHTLPDNHYKIYLVRVETNSRRLVVEVYVRNGKVIDPGDDSQGTRDRPPTDETTRQLEATGQLEEGQSPEIKQPVAGDAPAPVDPAPVPPDATSAELDSATTDALAPTWSESRQSPLNWAPAVAGLVATTSFRSWAEQVDQAVSQAQPRQWKRLRLRYPHKRKNR